MEMVVQKQMTLIDASTKLQISYRQGKRVYRRYCGGEQLGVQKSARKMKESGLSVEEIAPSAW